MRRVFAIEAPGTLNALRFATKNVVGVVPDDHTKSADWHMDQLVLPLAKPRAVQRGDRVRVRFASEAGAPIEALVQQLELADAYQSLEKIAKTCPKRTHSPQPSCVRDGLTQ